MADLVTPETFQHWWAVWTDWWDKDFKPETANEIFRSLRLNGVTDRAFEATARSILENNEWFPKVKQIKQMCERFEKSQRLQQRRRDLQERLEEDKRRLEAAAREEERERLLEAARTGDLVGSVDEAAEGG